MSSYCQDCKIELQGGDDPNKCAWIPWAIGDDLADYLAPPAACHNCRTWGPIFGNGDNPWYKEHACEGCKNRLLSGEFKASDALEEDCEGLIALAEEMITKLGGPVGAAKAQAAAHTGGGSEGAAAAGAVPASVVGVGVEEMQTDDVCQLLASLSFPQDTIEKFEAKGVSGKELLGLSDDDLKGPDLSLNNIQVKKLRKELDTLANPTANAAPL